jgi:hypothetical protein
MTPRDFALYDLLNCAAIAVGEAECGRPARADAAWLEAWASADGLFAPGSAADAAAGVLLRAASPDCGNRARARLWNALDAASKTALAAMDGRPGLLNLNLNGAFAAVAALDPPWRAAVTVILAEICPDYEEIAP